MCLTNISENSVATNISKHTHNDTSHEDWMSVPASQCISWLVVLITECLAIVILNTITIIVFMKQRQLQRQSTYLVIHLAIVDLLAGAVTGSLYIERIGSACDLWEYNRTDITWLIILEKILEFVFPLASLLNLVISLERVHATFCPFRHRFIKKWVYGVMITVIWLTPISMEGLIDVYWKKCLSKTMSIILLFIFHILFFFFLLFVFHIFLFISKFDVVVILNTMVQPARGKENWQEHCFLSPLDRY